MNKKDKRFFWTNIIVVVTGIIVVGLGLEPVGVIMTPKQRQNVILVIGSGFSRN